MTLAFLDRILSRGHSAAIPDRLARHVRVTNALALLGVTLAITGVPLDAFGVGLSMVLADLVVAAIFVSCWMLTSRGRYTTARVVLALVANAAIIDGVVETGAMAEMRVVFLPLAILPFLIFSVSERGWLMAFAVLPAVSYFVTGAIDRPPAPTVVSTVYMVYVPALAFTMTVAGAYVFTYIERNADTKLQDARTRAAEAARLVALGEMSSGIAHEIRNPLAAIHLAATHIAERPNNPTQVAQLGERITRIVMRASRIIDALRTFARDSSGDPFVPTPVERIIGDTLELCAKRFADHGVELTVGTLPPDLVVECRSVALSQVLVNLVGNAYDAVTPSTDRWVRIDLQADLDRLEIAVTDSGPGIPASVRPRLFEPFFTTKPPDRGTGLGLSLSRGLVEAHHGTLDIDTESPRTRFVIRIPLTQTRA